MNFKAWSFARAAVEHGVTPATARKWLERCLTGGESALLDALSRPACSPHSIDAGKALLILGIAEAQHAASADRSLRCHVCPDGQQRAAAF